MSFTRGGGRRAGEGDPTNRAAAAIVEQRLAVDSLSLGTGSLACARCDAPVALGGVPTRLTDPLACPFCGHGAPARDFLSMGAPTRPARVEVRLSVPLRRPPR